MKKIEEGLYKEINNLIKYQLNNIKNYLDGKETENIKDWKDCGIDDNFKILFGSKNLTKEEKEAIKNLYFDSVETLIASTLRFFEGDLYEIDGYEPDVDLDEYYEENPNWRGGLINVIDYNGESITDNTMYENFLEYIQEKKDNN